MTDLKPCSNDSNVHHTTKAEQKAASQSVHVQNFPQIYRPALKTSTKRTKLTLLNIDKTPARTFQAVEILRLML